MDSATSERSLHLPVTPHRKLGAVFADLGRCNTSASGEPAAQSAWETLACQIGAAPLETSFQSTSSRPAVADQCVAFCKVGVPEYRGAVHIEKHPESQSLRSMRLKQLHYTSF